MDFRTKQVWVKGLAIDCPLGMEVDTCPAKELRRLPVKKRLQVVNRMTEDELDALIEHHNECLARREGK